MSVDLALISVESVELIPLFNDWKEDTAELMALESEEMETLRVCVSKDIALLRMESTDGSETTCVLNALDRDETEAMCVVVSLDNMLESDMCEFMILVAKLGLFPIAFANSARVSNVLDNPEPAMDVILAFV